MIDKETPRKLIDTPLINNMSKAGSSGLGQIEEGDDEHEETCSLIESDLDDISEKASSR